MDEALRSYYNWLEANDAAEFEDLRTYRDFYRGEHDVRLTERQATMLGMTEDQIRSMGNYMRLAIEVLAERLSVERFEAQADATREQIAQWWSDNDLETIQDDVHLTALRDGDSYLSVEFDSSLNRPRFHHEEAYDGSTGVRVVYSDERRVALYAFKKWRIESGPNVGRIRLNMYWPDRFESYITGASGKYEAYIDPAAPPDPATGKPAWPIALIDNNGDPLGIPIIHFATNPSGNDYGTSELADLIPVQRIITMLLISVASQADELGFPIRTLSNGVPPEGMALSRGSLWYSQTGTYGSLPAADILQLVETLRYATMIVAQISRVPLTFFQDSKVVAAADTVQASEKGLNARVRDRAKAYAIQWREAMRYAVKLHNRYARAARLDPAGITAIYAPFEHADPLTDEDRRSSVAQRHIANGLSITAAYTLAGYSPEEIVVANTLDILGEVGITQ